MFVDEYYEKVEKVYSIWICPDPAKKRKNGIFKYHTVEDIIYGESYTKEENYDLMEVVVLNLGDADKSSDLEILDLLNVLFSATTTPEEKKQRLNDEFEIAMTVEFESEVQEMCNLSKALVEQGIKQGIKQGIELGKEERTLSMAQMMIQEREPIEKIEKSSRTKGSVTGIPTGFVDLDYQMSGFQPSDLILVAARPSMGKTAFVLNIAQYMAFRKDVTVAIFSLEMSKEQLVNRLLSLESKVDSQNIRTGNLEDEEWAKLIEGANIIGSSNMIIDDTPGISISELRSKCRKYKLEHNLGIIFIDYLQLMTGSGKRSESRQQEISDISRSLKALARELNVPVVALSQLSRAVEQRPDHRPMLSDLRESGAIEQDADVVMFIYRDEYYNEDSEKKGIAEIIVDKQRNGSTGSVELVWLGQYTKFGNKERAPH